MKSKKHEEIKKLTKYQYELGKDYYIFLKQDERYKKCKKDIYS